MAGLVCDTGNPNKSAYNGVGSIKNNSGEPKLFNTAAMNLYKFNNIYFPDEGFYNCQYFPTHWIEVFVEHGQQLEAEDIGQQDKKIQPYTPICTKAELRKMLEGNMKSTKYSNVKGKTYSNTGGNRNTVGKDILAKN